MNVDENIRMDAMELLHTRESAPKLQEPGPDDFELHEIFSSAVRAPDHGRLRPWRFIVIRGDARLQFGELMAASLSAKRSDCTPEMLARERAKALRAPMIIVVVAAVQTETKIREIEQVLSAGAAAQNILLAAHALGYGAIWKTGNPAYAADVKEGLGLAASDAIVAFLYVGTRVGGLDLCPRPAPQDFVSEWPAQQ